MILEHSLVVLTHDLPGHQLSAGDLGTVVHVYGQGLGYEVEFADRPEGTSAVITLTPEDICEVEASDNPVANLRSA